MGKIHVLTPRQLVATGHLRVHFDPEQRFDIFDFETTGHEEYISRRLVIQAARPAHNWVKEWRNLNQQDPKQSPEMSKKSKPKPIKAPAGAPPDLELPHSFEKNGTGITEAVFQFLEVRPVSTPSSTLPLPQNTDPSRWSKSWAK